MEDLRPLSYAIITILFVITLITIPMRIWVRGFAMKTFGWDDWLMASMIVRHYHARLGLKQTILVLIEPTTDLLSLPARYPVLLPHDGRWHVSRTLTCSSLPHLMN